MAQERPWRAYYEAVVGRPARPTLLRALDLAGPMAGFAVDLGCGAGNDTLELLRRGWRVRSVDREPDAIGFVRDRLPPDAAPRWSGETADFRDLAFPAADLVNASLSLPFCPPADFPAVWARLRASLRPGGRFAGHLFGVRDDWAVNPDLTFHTRADVEGLLAGLDVEWLDEFEGDTPTALDGVKRGHLFSVVARRP